MFRTGNSIRSPADLGFNITYKTFDCGGTLNGPTDIIRSINYPQQYPSNTDCAWLLEYPEGDQIVVIIVYV